MVILLVAIFTAIFTALNKIFWRSDRSINLDYDLKVRTLQIKEEHGWQERCIRNSAIKNQSLKSSRWWALLTKNASHSASVCFDVCKLAELHETVKRTSTSQLKRIMLKSNAWEHESQSLTWFSLLICLQRKRWRRAIKFRLHGSLFGSTKQNDVSLGSRKSARSALKSYTLYGSLNALPWITRIIITCYRFCKMTPSTVEGLL